MIIISSDKKKLQIDVIHQFLTNTYWAKGRTVEEVKTTIENSFCFGMYLNGEQIGFARVVSDTLVFAYLMDVFILPEHQKKGYSKQLLKAVFESKELRDCEIWRLKTVDAHGLYQQFGFTKINDHDRWMELKKDAK